MKIYWVFACKLLLLMMTGSLHAKVYDCMTFLNEVTTLEIRLEELYDQVDHFVIVEGKLGFSGQPKPLQFPLYQDRFEKYMDKIIYLPIEERVIKLVDHNGVVHSYGKAYTNAWDRSNAQKNSVCLALKACAPDDIILFSDVDEIPSREAFAAMISSLQRDEVIAFNHKMYKGYYNRRSTLNPYWIGTLAMHFATLNTLAPNDPNALRTSICFGGTRLFPERGIHVREIEGGWHFCSMGSFENYLQKMDSWEHYRNPCPRTAEGRRLEVVTLNEREEIDASFPIYMQEHEEEMFQENLLDDSDDY